MFRFKLPCYGIPPYLLIQLIITDNLQFARKILYPIGVRSQVFSVVPTPVIKSLRST